MIDLFDRRIKIYTACRDVLQKIICNPSKATTENAFEFLSVRADAEFLFDDKVVEYLKRVEDAIFDLATWEAELKGTVSKQDHKDLVEKSRKATAEV